MGIKENSTTAENIVGSFTRLFAARVAGLGILLLGASFWALPAHADEPNSWGERSVEAASPASVDFLAEAFSVASFSNQDGTFPWFLDWEEVGERNGPDRGRVRIRAQRRGTLQVSGENNGLSRSAVIPDLNALRLFVTFRVSGPRGGSGQPAYLELDAEGADGPQRFDLIQVDGGFNLAVFNLRPISNGFLTLHIRGPELGRLEIDSLRMELEIIPPSLAP